MEDQHRRRWPKSRRLTKNAQFQRVRSQGRSWAHPLLVLVAHPNDVGHTRVGVTASRRLGGAVERNRARRVLRETARLCYPQICPGWDLVLIARVPMREVQMPQVHQALEALLQRARLSMQATNGVQRNSAGCSACAERVDHIQQKGRP